jgi:serine/threonine protein kinase
MEANPPDARIRDLGSLNATHVNGVRYGGRKKHETPDEGTQRRYPEVDLKDGDRITVGRTALTVRLEAPPAAVHEKAKAGEPIRCQECGKDASKEAGEARRGDYICIKCREKAEAGPLWVLARLMRWAGAAESRIAGYEIEKKLGAGGFGAVYLARRKKDGERVAIKVMLAKVAVDAAARKKFNREIETMKGLRHDHVASILENGSVGGAFYFIMEYCPSGSVDDLMKRRGGKLALTEAGGIMLDAIDGLVYVHSHDIVHRDLKPSNILLAGSEGRWTAKISDLGLAKNFERAGFSSFTVTGHCAGSPGFMPREQLTDFKRVKPVSDIWSIGATFYNMLTGQVPRNFAQNRDPIEIILRDEVVPVRDRDPSVPRPVAAAIDRALAEDVKARFQTAAEMRDALTKALPSALLR